MNFTLHVSRISLACNSYVLVCHSYVPYVIRMSSVCHSYVIRTYSYITPMSLVCTRMSLVCTRMSFVCHSYVLVCHFYVTRLWFYHERSISFISSTIVHLIHIHHIWLHSYYIVIQPYCQFHLSANPVSGNWQPTSALDKVLILGRYSLLEPELRWFYYSLTLIWNKKYNKTFLYYFSIKFYLQEKYLLYITFAIKYIKYI